MTRVGFTVQLTEAQREAKRIEKLKSQFGSCDAGHPLHHENRYRLDFDYYCLTCVEAGTITPEPQRLVYFITDGTPYVKIGSARHVQGRLEDLQAGNPRRLTVLGTQPGGLPAERELHARFAAHRVHREWFELVPEIAGYIAGLPRPKPVKVPAYVKAYAALQNQRELSIP